MQPIVETSCGKLAGVAERDLCVFRGIPSHALELPFVFGALSDPMLINFAGSGPQAHQLAERMQEAWIAFARGRRSNDHWPTYDADRRATMLIDEQWRVAQAPLEEERRFWETVS